MLLVSQNASSQDDFWEAINQNQFSSIQPTTILDSIIAIKKIDEPKANKILLATENYFLSKKDPSIKSRFYINKCLLNKKEKIYADSALYFGQISNDSSLIAKAYIVLGQAYNTRMENEKALVAYNKVNQYTANKTDIFATYINSANLFLDTDNFEDAKYYLAKAKMLLPKVNRAFHADFYSLYGFIFLNTEKLDSSKYYYTKAVELSKEFKNERDVLLHTENLGIIEHEIGNIELAENIFFQILEQAEKLGDKKLQLFAYTDLIYLYKDIKDNDKALQAGLMQLALAEDTKLIRYKVESAELVYKLYEQKNDFENALKYMKIYQSVTDSLNSTKNLSGLTELKVSDQFKEQHIIDSLHVVNAEMTLSVEKHKRENITWLLGLALLATFISIFQFFRTKRAQKRSDELLLNILPKTTAEELKKTGATTSKRYDNVTILFADIKNFTSIGSKLSPEQLVEMLDFYFSKFDVILKKWNVEKIKTIGDAYMAVYGIDKTYSSQTINIVQAALEMQKFIDTNQHPHITAFTNETLAMRIGIHTGPLVAGVVGNTKFQFDVWGDAVNIASRIETSGEAEKVNISVDTYNEIKKSKNLDFQPRGSIKIKNRGEIEMFFVKEKETHTVIPRAERATE